MNEFHLTRCDKAVFKHCIYWVGISKNIYKGRRWFIQSATEMREKYGLDFAKISIWRSLRKLHDLGLIEKRKGIHFFSNKMLSANWITVTSKGFECVPLVYSKYHAPKIKEEFNIYDPHLNYLDKSEKPTFEIMGENDFNFDFDGDYEP